jgi:integration host factor subunit alpha
MQGTTNMNDVNSVELQSVLAADLNRAMLEAQVRSQAEKDLPTLTKAELAELLFEQVGLNKREAKDMVETFFDEIRNALERGEAVKLSGFGNFQLRDKPQRPGRNPRPARKFRSLHVGSLLSMQARSSRVWSKIRARNRLRKQPD